MTVIIQETILGFLTESQLGNTEHETGMPSIIIMHFNDEQYLIPILYRHHMDILSIQGRFLHKSIQ